jgi:DnaJ-domain-containing protein 1
MSRNTIGVYDAAFAQQQRQADASLAEPGIKVGKSWKGFRVSSETMAKMEAALAGEMKKARARDEERRRRDPSYRPDAIDLSSEHLLAFDRYVDYYARLEVDGFASLVELKKAYMRLSLKLHPDKLLGASDAELAAATQAFYEMTSAYEILGDMPTRREYDRARDKMDAAQAAGMVDQGKMDKPHVT